MDMVQWIGVWVFGAAAAACLVAGTRPWPLLGLVNACFAVEAALGWRRNLPAAIKSAISEATGSLGVLHLATLLLVIAAGVFVLAKLRRPAADGANSGAATATLLTALLFLVDTASLGGIDALLQREANGLPVIGWLWILLGAATILAALFAARHSGANKR
jgi:hypothetical protein